MFYLSAPEYSSAVLDEFIVSMSRRVDESLYEKCVNEEIITALKYFFALLRNRKETRMAMSCTFHDTGYRIVLKPEGASFPYYLEAINGWYMLRASDSGEVLTFDDQFKKFAMAKNFR